MRARVLAAFAALAAGAALLAAAADHEAGPDGQEQRSARDVAAPSSDPASAGRDAAAERAGSEPALLPPKRARVPAGVLVRAASRRAHEREAASPGASVDATASRSPPGCAARARNGRG